jgi:hypothetical protein
MAPKKPDKAEELFKKQRRKAFGFAYKYVDIAREAEPVVSSLLNIGGRIKVLMVRSFSRKLSSVIFKYDFVENLCCRLLPGSNSKMLCFRRTPAPTGEW